MTYADMLRPTARTSRLLFDLAVVLGGSLVVAASAQIRVPLGFSPVPITGQTLAVLLVGALLGSRRGAASMLTYLFEGTLGLPVFAGGASGSPHLLGPTGGYLVGFVAAGYLTGWLAERDWDRRPGTAIMGMLLGNGVIYLFGLPWLARFVGPSQAVSLGLAPFIPGDLLKIILAAILLPSGWVLLGRASRQVGGPRPK